MSETKRTVWVSADGGSIRNVKLFSDDEPMALVPLNAAEDNEARLASALRALVRDVEAFGEPRRHEGALVLADAALKAVASKDG
jgi:hypothetical protein